MQSLRLLNRSYRSLRFGGLVLLTSSQLRQLVRADLTALDLVGELLAERRAEAAADDAA